MSKIDRYLRQSLSTSPPRATRGGPAVRDTVLDEGGAASLSFGISARAEAEQPIAMLLRIADPGWTGEEIPDLQFGSRLGLVISCRGSEATLEALEQDPAVLSVEASRPMEPPDCDRSVAFAGGRAVQAPQSDFDERGDLALVAIIDSGIDPLHEAFLDDQGRTRIRAFWDQSDHRGPAPEGYRGGRLYRQSEIQALVDSDAGLASSAPRDRNGHGTHVASIAAGRAAGSFAGGMAPEAGLLVVRARLAVREGQPRSLGYSHQHVEAMAWAVQQARAARLPLVINISQGMNAGAHDGSSLLEAAFDEISGGGRAPGVAVVKSAGNSRGQKVHAHLEMLPGSEQILAWEAPLEAPNGRRRSADVVELWYSSADELEFQLEPPTGAPSDWVRAGRAQAQGQTAEGNRYALDLVPMHYDNGDSQLMVRVERGSSSGIEAGLWRLRVRAGIVHGAGVVHAWVERAAGQGIRFLEEASSEHTLSIPATARTVISVASISSSEPLQLAASSSWGPTRDGRFKPDLSAPGEQIQAAQSGTSGGTVTMSGTSMAAPHVSGALALLLSAWEKKLRQVGRGQQLNAVQLRAALVRSSRSFNGHWNRGMGFGALDAEALLQLFAELEP